MKLKICSNRKRHNNIENIGFWMKKFSMPASFLIFHGSTKSSASAGYPGDWLE
jgi:hypothetical protein